MPDEKSRGISLGIDLGTNSIGWAAVERDEQGAHSKLVDWGVYLFAEAFEEDGKGIRTTYASERGKQRRMRRTLRRRSYRRNKLIECLVESGMMPPEERGRFEELTRHAVHTTNGIREVHPYALRAEAVTQRIELHELGKALYHLCRHRGFLSTRELMQMTLQHALGEDLKMQDDYEPTEEESDESASEEAKETGKYKKQIAEFREMLREQNQTAGQALFKAMKRGERVRCRPYKEDKKAAKQENAARKQQYEQAGQGYRLARQMLIDEFHLMWDEQQKHHPVLLDHNLRKRVFDAIFYQNPLQDQKHLRGYCSFHPSRRRSKRASLLSQRSSVLQKLNQLRLIDSTRVVGKKPKSNKKEPANSRFFQGRELIELEPADRKLTTQEIQTLFEALQVRETLSWAEAKQILGVPDTMMFSEEPVRQGRAAKNIEGGRAYPHLVGNLTSAKMAQVLPEFMSWSLEKQEELVHDVLELTPKRGFERLTTHWELPERQARALIYEEYPEGFASVCRKVQRKMEPYLLQGMVYSEAMAAAGYDHANPSAVEHVDRLSMDQVPLVNNPIVKRSVAQAFKVINAVIAKYGKPERIRIEIPRDVSKTNKQREEDWKYQDERKKERDKAKNLLKSNGHPAFRMNVDKVLLWQEFGQVSPYDPSTAVTIDQLVRDYDIDHILPRSRTADDSWTNKTICSRHDNLEKGNRTPFEQWGNTPRWTKIKAACLKAKRRRNQKKVNNILLEDLNTELAEGGFVGRQLSDTGYISRLVLNSIQKLGVKVEVGRGSLTAMARRLWGLEQVLPREKARDLLRKAGLEVNKINVDKVMLWQEFGQASPYDPATPVSIRELIHDYGIDIIVPGESEDAWVNKTICSTRDRLTKGNKTPIQTWEGTPRWKSIVEAMSKASGPGIGAKVRKILGAGRDFEEVDQPAQSEKKRDDHRHHGVDALAIACIDLSLFQKLTKFYQANHETPSKNRVQLDPPWEGFAREAKNALPRMHVVHAPNRRVRGAIHEATARTPPPKPEVDAAIQAMPPERRKHMREFVQVGKQLVRVDRDGTPLCAYNLGNNHHGVVWRSRKPDAHGEYRWDFSVVTVLEAKSRIRAGEPLFQRERGEWVAHMHLCKGDVVEWGGEHERFEPGLYRVSALFDSGGPAIEVRLYPLNAATATEDIALRIRSKKELRNLTRRVSLGPIGDVAAWQAAP